jgi:hypothetical protein
MWEDYPRKCVSGRDDVRGNGGIPYLVRVNALPYKAPMTDTGFHISSPVPIDFQVLIRLVLNHEMKGVEKGPPAAGNRFQLGLAAITEDFLNLWRAFPGYVGAGGTARYKDQKKEKGQSCIFSHRFTSKKGPSLLLTLAPDLAEGAKLQREQTKKQEIETQHKGQRNDSQKRSRVKSRLDPFCF